MKVSELEGAKLDLWAAKAEGYPARFSSDWFHGGPIIEREISSLDSHCDGWTAIDWNGCSKDGPTPLIAAMRCYVASKFGEEVPD